MKTTSRIALMLLLSLLVSSTLLSLTDAQLPSAGISLTKTPSATYVVNGTTVSYLYNATNTGETALTGGIYDDVFGPVGYFVDLQPGGWVGFNVSHVINATTTNVATAIGVDEFGQVVTDSDCAIVMVKIPQVIPEVPIGTVLAAISMVIAFGAYSTRLRKRKKQVSL